MGLKPHLRNDRCWRKADVRPESHAASGGELAQPDWENHDIEIN